MAPAAPTGSPALPWAVASSKPAPEAPAPEQDSLQTPADLLTEEQRAAAVPSSITQGMQLEVLWEVDDEEGSGYTWWPATAVAPNSDSACPPNMWKIRYAAQHGQPAEDAQVTFTAPGELQTSADPEPMYWRHAPAEEDPVSGTESTEAGQDTEQDTVTLSELVRGVDTLERVMGSLDARLADQLKDLPMAKQQRMVDGFKQWASHMSAKLAAVQGTVEADDVKEIAKSFR